MTVNQGRIGSVRQWAFIKNVHTPGLPTIRGSAASISIHIYLLSHFKNIKSVFTQENSSPF